MGWKGERLGDLRGHNCEDFLASPHSRFLSRSVVVFSISFLRAQTFSVWKLLWVVGNSPPLSLFSPIGNLDFQVFRKTIALFLSAGESRILKSLYLLLDSFTLFQTRRLGEPRLLGEPCLLGEQSFLFVDPLQVLFVQLCFLFTHLLDPLRLPPQSGRHDTRSDVFSARPESRPNHRTAGS